MAGVKFDCKGIQLQDLPDEALQRTASSNVITRRVVEIFLAEILGTFFLMFFGCMSLIALDDLGVPPLAPAFMFGFVVSSVIAIIGHISRAHLNPAVTVASLILGDISTLDSGVYIVAQFIGCTLGYAMLGVITPQEFFTMGFPPDRCLCGTFPHPRISTAQAFLAEFLATSLIVLTCCGVWDHRNAHAGDSNPIKFALAVALCGATVGPYTGASMNPARSLGPAFMNNVWSQQWIYLTAPLLAAVVCPLLYMYIFEPHRLGRSSQEEKSPDLAGVKNECFTKN